MIFKRRIYCGDMLLIRYGRLPRVPGGQFQCVVRFFNRKCELHTGEQVRLSSIWFCFHTHANLKTHFQRVVVLSEIGIYFYERLLNLILGKYFCGRFGQRFIVRW